MEVFREFYFNPDFDATLRGRPSPLDSPAHTFLHEMGMHFLFAGGEEDSLILRQPLPADFLTYLGRKGLSIPRIVEEPNFTPGALFTPFGWNASAEARNRLYAHPAEHPSLEAVKTVNSRAFSQALEREWTGGKGSERPMWDTPDSWPSGPFHSLESLETYLAAHAQTTWPEARNRVARGPSELDALRPSLGWMVKANHGYAGTANRRLPSGSLTAKDKSFVESLLAENGQVVLEPWQERLMDIGVQFTLEPDGAVRNPRGHELLNSRDGAFLGVKITPSRQAPELWRSELTETVPKLARALHAQGYFGPVSLDAYVWESAQGPRLRALVDINARHSMALPAHELALRLPGKSLLWRWFNARKLILPETYEDLETRLGPAAFNRETSVGILATSPLRLNASQGNRQGGVASPRMFPKRIGFLISADGEAELTALRKIFGRVLLGATENA